MTKLLLRRLPSYDTFLVVCGLLAIFSLANPPAGLFVGFGLAILLNPVAIVLIFIPTIFLFLLIARFCHFALEFSGLRLKWFRITLSAVIALVTMAAVPYFQNWKLDRIANALVEGDRTDITAPFNARTLGMIKPSSGDPHDDTACDDFCMRLLLNRVVENVVVVNGNELDPQAEGRLFRMEKRDTCPLVNYTTEFGTRFKPDGQDTESAEVSSGRTIRLKRARGNCLIREIGSIGDADLVIFVGQFYSGASPSRARIDPFADAISANRISYFVREFDGFAERYRSTDFRISKLLPLFLPFSAEDGSFVPYPGFLRYVEYKGTAGEFDLGKRLSKFLTDVLELELVLQEPAT